MNPVVESARSVTRISEHVKLDRSGIERAARQILDQLIREPYTPSSWAQVPLHPVPSLHSPEFILNWVFLVSSLNFSFWSALPTDERFGVLYTTACDGKAERPEEHCMWTGYFSLLAALWRAIERGVDVTNPAWYGTEATDEDLEAVFASDQAEPIPLLKERIVVLRQVGSILCQRYGGSVKTLIESCHHSALDLVETVTSTFACYDDRTTYPPLSTPILIRKRAQILVAETWAAFEGQDLGKFDDIDQLTMFADYRVPQILHSLGTLEYDQHVTSILEQGTNLDNGSKEEVEIRCASIVVVEEIKHEIERLVTEQGVTVKVPNAVLLDFLLWDLAKVEEKQGRAVLPHHRTRSVFY
ncbi:queuosine 5'-phosphate N-glycosylase/hydrolase [Sporobolomyces koalae]|uniref:queuosine 5'-phosphate N-glycosylase/hydrolase n=1 Tax=Sporobolomyces koalae TaxID=500713 RepID=UPI00316B2ECF